MKRSAAWVSLALFIGTPTLAQEPGSATDASLPAAGTSVFQPKDFERFSPQTALDMVRQVPGVSIDGANRSRGLGQASSNVLINGERLASKANDAIDVLGRVPAARVLRIEVVEAASLGIPGLSGRVVNVITERADLSGVWSWEGRLRERLEPRYNRGSFALSGQRGNIDWTVGLATNGERFGNKGPEFVFDPDDQLIETRDDDFEGAEESLEGAVGLVWTPPNRHEFNFNATYATLNFNRRVRGNQLRLDEPDTFRLFRGGDDEWNSEISGDYALPALGGTARLIGYYRHADRRGTSTVVERRLDDGAIDAGRRRLDDTIENEAVARTEFDWSAAEGRDWQLAGEIAYNRLDAGASDFDIAADGTFFLDERDTPTLVDEVRAEISATHTRQLTPKLAIQASLSAEYSELASEFGDDTQSQDFIRPKGYVSGTYAFSDDFITTLRLEREVGQLDFDDFVESQDFVDENALAANRDIVPDQTWRAEILLDRTFGDLGASTLTVFHEEIEDSIDQVPLGDGSTGPGNVDSARRTGLEVEATLSLDRFGLTGVQWDLSGSARHSRIDDPLTGQSRWISRRRVSGFSSELRWDVPGTPYAFSLAFEQDRRAQTYRIDEISQSNSIPGFASIEAEHKDLFGLNAFIRIANLLDQKDLQDRLVFEPDRLGTPEERRTFERDFGHILVIGLSGSF